MNSPNHSWIGKLSPRTRALGLLGLILEGICLAALALVPVGQIVLLLFGAAFIMAALIVAIVMLERPGQRLAAPGEVRVPEPTHACVTIPTREELYRKCEALISRAEREVLDTTWGSTPPAMNDDELAAQAAYIHARERAVESKDGFRYKELFTLPADDDPRRRRLDQAAQDGRSHPAYHVRVLRGLSRRTPLPDFLVVDSTTVVISNVASQGTTGAPQFLALTCPVVAALFRDWFFECWHRAEDYEERSAEAGPEPAPVVSLQRRA